MRFKTQEERDAYNTRRREEYARHKETYNAHRRWLYRHDEEFREKLKEYARTQRSRKNELHRERMADPEYAERWRQYRRDYNR